LLSFSPLLLLLLLLLPLLKPAPPTNKSGAMC
jgi:hypothetical protein